MSQLKKSFLLTWNPEKYNHGGSGTNDYTLNLSVGQIERWNCNTKQINPEDDIYVIRLGVEPRGIVLKGTVTKASYQDEDWADPEKQRRYIDFQVQELRMTCAEGLLPMALLVAAIPEQKWSPQSSGIEIQAEASNILNSLWGGGAEKHSLRQFVEWDVAARRGRDDGWARHYKETISLIRDITEHKAPLDDDALDTIWKKINNGISSVSPGGLLNIDYENNKSFLHDLTLKILAEPNKETMQYVVDAWKKAKKDKKFKYLHPSVINRVFAGAAPNIYATILSGGKCRALLKTLNHCYQLSENISGDWIYLNHAIKSSLEKAGVDNGNTLENNMAMWRLYELSSNAKGGSIESEQIVDDASENIAGKENLMKKTPLNQILFGPPGTGKTYHTIDEALRILEPPIFETIAGLSEVEARSRLLERFNFYRAEERVVFCTFHQSFSYEDFVEGLRAEVVDDKVNYVVGRGVFKKLCDDITAPKGALSIDDAVSRFVEDVAESPLELETATGKKFNVRYKPGNTTLTCTPLASKSGLELPANINHVRDVLQGSTPENLYCESYVKGIVRYIKQKYLQITDVNSSNHNDGTPRVLIIDEINRGNISKIFGELITLIEPSKRAGEKEALEVILPYSKQPFSVPANVYIIGTMNTSDRSLAGLDIALRRRFTFKEMPPKPELLDEVDVAGINIGKLLAVMNQRVEVLLGRDYCLGHAYFMSLSNNSSIDDLAIIFQKQIIPLLQEYLFEDWERIQWVLNDHRKEPIDRFIVKSEYDLASLFGSADNLNLSSLPWVLNDEAYERVEAFLGVIDHQLKTQNSENYSEWQYNNFTIRLISSGSVEVWCEGKRLSPTKPHLRTIAVDLDVETRGSQGSSLNTRSLGRKIIAALEAEKP